MYMFSLALAVSLESYCKDSICFTIQTQNWIVSLVGHLPHPFFTVKLIQKNWRHTTSTTATGFTRLLINSAIAKVMCYLHIFCIILLGHSWINEYDGNKFSHSVGAGKGEQWSIAQSGQSRQNNNFCMYSTVWALPCSPWYHQIGKLAQVHYSALQYEPALSKLFPFP